MPPQAKSWLPYRGRSIYMEGEAALGDEAAEQEVECRICGDTDGQFCVPCGCLGGSKFAHQACIQTWINTKTAGGLRCDSCEVCGVKWSDGLFNIPEPTSRVALEEGRRDDARRQLEAATNLLAASFLRVRFGMPRRHDHQVLLSLGALIEGPWSPWIAEEWIAEERRRTTERRGRRGGWCCSARGDSDPTPLSNRVERRRQRAAADRAAMLRTLQSQLQDQVQVPLAGGGAAGGAPGLAYERQTTLRELSTILEPSGNAESSLATAEHEGGQAHLALPGTPPRDGAESLSDDGAFIQTAYAQGEAARIAQLDALLAGPPRRWQQLGGSAGRAETSASGVLVPATNTVIMTQARHAARRIGANGVRQLGMTISFIGMSSSMAASARVQAARNAGALR